MLLQNQKRTQGNEADADLRDGIRYLDQALEIYPGNWAGLWFRGKAYQALGDHQRAYESFHRAYGVDGSRVGIGRELSLECLELGMADEGLKVARAMSELAPRDAGLRANLALALLLHGEVEAARVAVIEALFLDPKDQATRLLRDVIEEVRSGKRPQPKRTEDLSK